MSDVPPATSSPGRLSRAAWHRKASRPVTWWMMALVIGAFVHWAIPEYPWVLLHMFTLGVVGTSILIWSQHFTEQFLDRPLGEDARPWQVRRIYLYTAGVIATIVGVATATTGVIHAGATVVGGCAGFHAVVLLRQYRAAPARNPLVLGYVGSTAMLVAGALLGAIVATGGAGLPPEHLRLAHLSINVLGFVGLSAITTLSALFPRIWQEEETKPPSGLPLVLLAAGVVVIAISALVGVRYGVAAGLALYLAGMVVAVRRWAGVVLRAVAQPGGRLTFPALAVAAAPLWLVGATIWLLVRVIRAEDLSAIELPTLPLIVGFGAQLLMGTMAYLLPTRVGGGPGAVATGLAVHDRAGMFRFGLINAGLAVWLLSEQSWLKVVASIGALGALAVFLILAPVAAKAQVAVIRRQRPPLSPSDKPKTGQLALALSVIALMVASFGGLGGGGGTPQVDTASVDPATIHRVEVSTQGMQFIPNSISVPADKTLMIVLHNTDDQVHDLRFPNGARTGRVQPGDTAELLVGQLTETTTGWCTIAGHHAQGMEITVTVTGTTTNTPAADTPSAPPPSSEGVTSR